ncbi:hypothetical protein GIB67_041271 [Kingdonia uniflora]|uniref:LysM domain-containing protein n=1 Tax=Kingdonia uniflora TaxID=39325 RepID=A0A7J7NIM4_9MAGN|nr:hypothetical protein GIB67_041271 [Kingdonia uniflora]
MKTFRHLPNLNQCILFLQSCAFHKNLTKGKETHSWMLVNGFLTAPPSVTSLINMYSKCSIPLDAISVFKDTHHPNIFAWNAIIAGLISNGLSRDAFEFFRRMRWEDNGVYPDKFTFPCVIKACLDLGEVYEVWKIHADLFKVGLANDEYVVSSLINFYLKFSFMVEAWRLFDELGEGKRDVVLWNAMINGYAKIGGFNMAFQVFGRMVEEGVTPSKFTVTGIISIFSMTRDVSNGRAVHGFVKKIGYESDEVVSNSLIDMYGKCKLLGDADWIFVEMPKRDIFSWNSIMSVHEQAADYDGTLKLFDRMRNAGVVPDIVSITTVLPACSHLAALVHGKEIHGHMIVNGYCGDFHDAYVGNAVMDMYAKCGSLNDAQLVFDKKKNRDIASWNIMIMGYGLHGFGDEALVMFSRMREAHMIPNEVTFVAILSACSHGGLCDQGREILEHMELDHGVVPTVEHYTCVVDMLGRAGKLNEAYELACSMPIEPNPIVWTAFLAACRLHGNADLAKIAAERVFELDPSRSGSYVLISNVYGSVGRYEDVSEMRGAMKTRNVKKAPGCSWFGSESWERKKRLLADHIHLQAQKWKFHGLVHSKDGQSSSNQLLIHVVKKGETLTSISRQYGVSIQAIVVANSKIVNVDVVLEGDRLKIPAFIAEETQVGSIWRSWSCIEAKGRRTSSKILKGLENQKILTMMASHNIQAAKITGYLLLAPLVAFCIRCILGVFHRRRARSFKHQDINASGSHDHGSRSIRWKTALRDIREPDAFDTESRKDSVDPLEDRSEAPFEDISSAYTELDPAYQKFLSECGMSNWGYWRGGGSNE